MPIVENRENFILSWVIPEVIVDQTDPEFDFTQVESSTKLKHDIHLFWQPDAVIVKYCAWYDSGSNDAQFKISSDLVDYKEIASLIENPNLNQINLEFNLKKPVSGGYTFYITYIDKEDLEFNRNEYINDAANGPKQTAFAALKIKGKVQIALEFVKYAKRKY